MGNWPIILLGTFLLSSVAKADPTCAPAITQDHVEDLVIQTKEHYFPELSETKVVLKTFRSDAYFLQAQPLVPTLLKQRVNRTYALMLNLKLLDCPPSDEALTAILIHELEHVKDYTQWSTLKIAGFSMNYARSLTFRASYERETDRKALEKGVHEGLAGYREWVYQWLSPKELKRKKIIYLTPQEIRSETK